MNKTFEAVPKASDRFKIYLNDIMGKIPSEIHDELWNHLVACISESLRPSPSQPEITQGMIEAEAKKFEGCLAGRSVNPQNGVVQHCFIAGFKRALELLSGVREQGAYYGVTEKQELMTTEEYFRIYGNDKNAPSIIYSGTKANCEIFIAGTKAITIPT